LSCAAGRKTGLAQRQAHAACREDRVAQRGQAVLQLRLLACRVARRLQLQRQLHAGAVAPGVLEAQRQALRRLRQRQVDGDAPLGARFGQPPLPGHVAVAEQFGAGEQVLQLGEALTQRQIGFDLPAPAP
jgi:hypothetical protein